MFGLPGGTDMIVLFVIALLIFGKRTPEVARAVAKHIVDFRKSLQDLQNDVKKDLHEVKREVDSVHQEVKKQISAHREP